MRKKMRKFLFPVVILIFALPLMAACSVEVGSDGHAYIVDDAGKRTTDLGPAYQLAQQYLNGTANIDIGDMADDGDDPTPTTGDKDDDASNGSTSASCEFPAPGNLDSMPKVVIETASANTWFHRVYNERLFHAPDWGGADSWFVTLALGDNSGGAWTDHGNPGQIVYRGTETHLKWCLGVLTTSEHQEEFLSGADGPVAINVRIAPHSVVTVTTVNGNVVEQETSDMGDITIILPDDGAVTISVDYSTAAPTHESLVWWGPYDRSESINTVDASATK